jgi:hypothetical protein
VQQLDKVEGDLAAEKNRNQELQQQVKKEKEKVVLLLQRAEKNLAAEKDRVKEAKKEVEMEKNILMEQLQAANENLATVKRKFGELIEGAVSWHETIHKKISIHTPMPQYCFIKNMFDEMAPSAIRSQCLKWRKMEEDKRPTKKHRGVRETSVPDIHIRIGDDGEVLEGEDEKTDVEGENSLCVRSDGRWGTAKRKVLDYSLYFMRREPGSYCLRNHLWILIEAWFNTIGQA